MGSDELKPIRKPDPDDALLEAMDKNPDSLAMEVSRIKVERAQRRWECHEIKVANLRAVRALLLALTALHDAWQDIGEVSWNSEGCAEEVRAQRTKAYNILKPLLASAGEHIWLLPDDPVRAEDGIASTIKECSRFIELRLNEIREESLEPLREKLRKFQRERGKNPPQE